MSRKPRLTEKELELLARAASLLPGATAEDVKGKFSELGGRRLSKSTVDKKLAKWRKAGKIAPAKATLPREERPVGLEAAWSLGVSTRPDYGITPEATRTLLAVWKYTLAMGHVLTIREARWVARLRSAFDGSRIAEIFAHAYEYSVRERICEILNKPIDTTDLDANMYIEDRERYVYLALGLIPKLAVPYSTREKEMAAAKFKYIAWFKQAATNIAFNHIPKAAMRTATEASRRDQLQKLFGITEELSGDQDRIYAALLLYLSKGPKWDTLSVEEYLQILSGLREWVTEVLPSKEPLEYAILDAKGEIKPTNILDPAFLEAVGYEVTAKEVTKETQNER